MKRNLLDKKFHFVITGNFASGKSTLIQILKKKGFNVIQADIEIAKLYESPKIINILIQNKIIKKKSDVKQQIKKFVLQKNIAGLLKLEKIIIPKLLEAFDITIKKNNLTRKKITFFELPTLFENQLSNNFNQVIVIGVARSIRKQRLKKNLRQHSQNIYISEQDKLDEKKLNNILICRQYSFAKQKTLANSVIYNGANKSFLVRKINHFINTKVTRNELYCGKPF